MNKQIEKLALECGAWNQVYGDQNFMIKETFDVEKFAQLIVRECANYITEYYPHSRYEAFYMKKHFGVES